jgi:tetratricopeptide (TPR) repeat protein
MMVLRGVAASCVLLVMAPQSPPRDTIRRALADFPPHDWRAAGLHSRDLARKSAAREGPALVEELFGQERVAQALEAALRTVQRDGPEAVVATLNIVTRQSSLRDPRAKGLVEAARSRLPSFPREAAARIARALVMPSDVGAPGWSERYVKQLRSFIQEYSGTQTALLTEVDILVRENENDDERTFAALDAFIGQHPRSAAAARALRSKAFRLAQPRRPPAPGSDPTARFLRLMDVVDELESGRYPASEVGDTLELVLRFTALEPKYAPETIDRVIDRYRAYAERHLDLDEQNPASNGVGYILTNRLSQLFAQKGQRDSGVERVLLDLARRAPDPFAVDYLRALFYLRIGQESPADPAASFGESARKVLEDIHIRARGLYQRKALATLATLQAGEGQFAAARVSFERYVAMFPTSDFAWVAALRAGQCLLASGDAAGAVKAFNAARARYASVRPAEVLGHAYAARALESTGQVAAALTEYEAAQAKWDNEYGQDYSIGALQPDRKPMIGDEAQVSRDVVGGRITSLRQAARSKTGALLEHARWLVANNRSREAMAALDQLARSSGALPSEARELKHSIRLEDALVLASDSKRQTEALAALTSLSREPFDFAVGAAGMAKASILWKRGSRGGAQTTMRQALNSLSTSPPPAPLPVLSPLEQDVAAIRDLAFRPQGDGAFKGSKWESYELTAARQPFFIVSAEITVSVADGSRELVPVHRRPTVPGATVLSLTAEQLDLLARIVTAVGGTATRQRTSVMDPFNQPGPEAAALLGFWNRFFPTQAGHWGGSVLRTYPIVTMIRFADQSRTTAFAEVTIGYSGSTLVCEKRNGRWIAVGLQGMWVT